MKKYKYIRNMVNLTTPKEVLEIFKSNITYSPDTGDLCNTKTNKLYSTLCKKGYLSPISIRWNNEEWSFISHRLCWFLYYGEILPKEIQIDHINQIKNDNSILNLRKATQNQNQYNTKVRVGKYKGVTYRKGREQYITVITINKIKYTIGQHTSEEEAAKYYDSAARFYHKEFAYCNFEEEFIPPMSIEGLKKLILINKPKIKSKKRKFSEDQLCSHLEKLNSGSTILQLSIELNIDPRSLRRMIKRYKNETGQ